MSQNKTITEMVKLFLALLLICLFVGRDGVTVKRLNPKTRNVKTGITGLKTDNWHANRTYFKQGAAKWKELQQKMKLPSNEILQPRMHRIRM